MDDRLNSKEFDAIIVGSGPGGATVARELSKRKKKVLILERGGSVPLKEGFLPNESNFNVVPVSDDLATARVFTPGGTTAIYFAVTGFPSVETFLSMGVDISKELDETKKELPLAILPDELLGAQTIKLRESATELGYAWKKNPMLVDISKCPFGYTYDAKWNARSYLQQAVEGGATLITQARVLKVLVEKGRAIGVEYKLKNGKTESEILQVFATRIILAAGASASPIILRDSGIKSVVNSGFYCCPSFALFGMISGPGAGDTFIGSMGAECEDGIALGDANPARNVYRMFMFGNRRFARAFFHSKSIGVAVKIMEGLGGGLQEDGRYYKRLEKEDLKKLEKGEEAARRIIQNAGGKRIFKSRMSAGQMGGTIRIKKHLDENLQTEYSNLHVCDGAVIPENVKVPPTLTLVCLGKYLANHLSHIL
ncbi:MAG TPA: GMC family oxidoreductase N-terminal domain-containing protein [Terriglobales bacterium]|nr:GMC family oxidoreductase N-terminal domain-containing protein [Terriglobales bacterium]